MNKICIQKAKGQLHPPCSPSTKVQRISQVMLEKTRSKGKQFPSHNGLVRELNTRQVCNPILDTRISVRLFVLRSDFSDFLTFLNFFTFKDLFF